MLSREERKRSRPGSCRGSTSTRVRHLVGRAPTEHVALQDSHFPQSPMLQSISQGYVSPAVPSTRRVHLRTSGSDIVDCDTALPFRSTQGLPPCANDLPAVGTGHIGRPPIRVGVDLAGNLLTARSHVPREAGQAASGVAILRRDRHHGNQRHSLLRKASWPCAPHTCFLRKVNRP